jgi:hypothetical protein
MRKLLIVSFLFGLVIVPTAVFGLGYDIPKGDLPRPVAWPASFYDELNQPNRVHGYSFNQFESHFYQGTCAELNSTLKHLSQIEGVGVVVVIHVGPGKARSPWSKTSVSPADWSIGVEHNNSTKILPVTLDLWLSERVTLSELEVPASIEVKNGGEIERFIDKHKAISEN